MLMRSSLVTLVAACALIAAGCVGGGGSGNGSGGGGGPGGTGSNSQAASHIILDLLTGQQIVVGDIGDLGSNNSYRDSFMVFRWVPGGSFEKGTRPGVMGATYPDEGVSQREVDGFYLGVFEVTQSQWNHLIDGRQAWQQVSPSSEVGSTATTGGLPAFALSLDVVNTMLLDTNHPLRLPTADEWEYAAKAGRDCLFSWGDNINAVEANAVLRESINAAGAQVVGRRNRSPFGLYDMHGNVWEWTDEGQLRGGSWADNAFIARAANKVDYPISDAGFHGCVGVRLILER